jgi:hypothetical protein
VATVLLRGSTDSILDDLERAVDDGVNTYKVCVPCWLKLISLRCTYCISLLGMLNWFLTVGVYTSQCAGIVGSFQVLQQQR